MADIRDSQQREETEPGADNSTVSHSWHIGKVLLDGYKIKGVLGCGGMGNVYLVERKIFKEKLQHPDYMIGFSTGGCYEEKYFLKDIASIKQGEIVEAMFHPGPKNIDKEELKAWGYKWDVDAKTLCSNKFFAITGGGKFEVCFS